MNNNTPFDPDFFNDFLKVKDVTLKHEHLLGLNFKEVSLAQELIKLNYEIITAYYIDFEFEKIEDYYDLDVDPII